MFMFMFMFMFKLSFLLVFLMLFMSLLYLNFFLQMLQTLGLPIWWTSERWSFRSDFLLLAIPQMWHMCCLGPVFPFLLVHLGGVEGTWLEVRGLPTGLWGIPEAGIALENKDPWDFLTAAAATHVFVGDASSEQSAIVVRNCSFMLVKWTATSGETKLGSTSSMTSLIWTVSTYYIPPGSLWY